MKSSLRRMVVGDSNKELAKEHLQSSLEGQYRIRAELYQKPGGDFGFSGEKSMVKVMDHN